MSSSAPARTTGASGCSIATARGRRWRSSSPICRRGASRAPWTKRARRRATRARRFLEAMIEPASARPRSDSCTAAATMRRQAAARRRRRRLVNAARPRPTPADDAPHVLVVDDDRRIRDLLSRFLTEHGYRVTTASDAAEARAPHRELVFDLYVLDVMMPGENGFDLAALGARDVDRADPDAHGPRRREPTACAASRSAPTTTCPSPSSRANCCCGSNNIIRRDAAALGAGLGTARVRALRPVHLPHRTRRAAAGRGDRSASPSASARS